MKNALEDIFSGPAYFIYDGQRGNNEKMQPRVWKKKIGATN